MSEPAPVESFLRDFSRALHASGATAPDLERHVGDLGAKLGVSAQGFALPTMLTIAVEVPGGQQHLHMMRLPPSDYNMVRLIELEALAREFAGPESLPAARERLATIVGTPPPWLGWKLVLCGFLLSGGVATLFNGSWYEMLCGGILGIQFVLAFLLFSRWPRLGPVLPVVLCAITAFLGHALCLVFPQQNEFVSVLSGIVLLLPGFMTTIALSELATQNLLAGSGRLAGAFILLVMMGSGMAIGSKLGAALIPLKTTGSLPPVPEWVFWTCLAALAVSFLGVLQAPVRAMHVMISACFFAYTATTLITSQFGGIAGAFGAAFLVAFVGHVYQRFAHKPAVLFQVPGVLTLVPGSVGFRGLSALIEQNFLEGIKITTEMVLTATALAVGILLANGIAPLLLNPKSEKMTGGRSPGIM